LIGAVWDALDAFERDDDCGVAILTGAGNTFSSGLDLKAFAATGEAPDRIDDLMRRVYEKPMIAAIEGYALGGGLELALLCDLLVVSRDAKLGTPEAKVGLFAAGGGVLRLPQRVPYALAVEMAFTAEPISAQRAYDAGLASGITEPGGALDGAIILASKIASNAPLALSAMKALFNARHGISDAEFWALQQAYIDGVLGSADAIEGANAFAEKRAPVWKRR
jgi:enoyl-CoA hydratase